METDASGKEHDPHKTHRTCLADLSIWSDRPRNKTPALVMHMYSKGNFKNRQKNL